MKTDYPSVTAILDYFGNKEALVSWSNGLGLKGRKYSDESKYHKDTGSLTHSKIELYLQEEDKGSFDLIKKIKELESPYNGDSKFSSSIAFQSFKKVFNENEIIKNLEVIYQEKKIVHEKLKFCGIMDFYGKYKEEYYLIDYKTSSKIRPFYILQLAAYSLLLEQEEKKVDKYIVLRLDKNNINYEILIIDNLEREKKIFKSMIKMYKILTDFENKILK